MPRTLPNWMFHKYSSPNKANDRATEENAKNDGFVYSVHRYERETGKKDPNPIDTAKLRRHHYYWRIEREAK